MDKSKTPARFYNQINGKTANENYQDILKQRRLKAQETMGIKAEKIELEKIIEEKLSFLLEQKTEKLIKVF